MADKPWFASTGPLWTVAIGLALAVVMILAILAPRVFGLEETSWWVTVGIGVAIGAAVVIYGYAKRDAGDADVTSPKH
jgi:threonine/homoserine efflux transporter RhtA